MKFTKSTVSQLVLPAGKTEHLAWDDDIPGFGIRLRAGGSQNWIFQYRLGTKHRRITFGSVSAVEVKDARERAGQLHALVKLGQDPAGQKIEARGKAAETFRVAMELFLAYQKARLKRRSFEETERHLRTHAKPLHGRQLAHIDKRAVATLVAEIATASGPAAANRVRASLSKFFSWAIAEGLLDINPVMGTNKAIENGARERVLVPAELREIWVALDGDDEYAAIVKLLMLTALRREEIGGLRREEVQIGKSLIALPGERTKNGLPHDVPLSGAAVAILKKRLEGAGERDLVFGRGGGGYSGWSRSKERLDARIHATRVGRNKAVPQVDGMASWTLHDFRRVFSTVAHEELGIAPHIVEACLNHVSGHKRGVAGVYNRAQYAKEKASAMAKWAEYLAAIVETREAKVVAFRPNP